jgi:hypothetical protein
MTFDPNDHPRSTDGTFAEKVGSSAEVKLSVSELDHGLFDDVRTQAGEAYETYGRALATERIQRKYPTAVRATVAVTQHDEVTVSSIEDADGVLLWEASELNEGDAIHHAAASIPADAVQNGSYLDLGGTPDSQEAFTHYHRAATETQAVAVQALANSIRLRFPEAVSVEMDADDADDDDPDIERRPTAVFNAAGEKMWTSGSGDESIFAPNSRDREYLQYANFEYDGDTDAMVVRLPVNLFDESTWPESTPF